MMNSSAAKIFRDQLLSIRLGQKSSRPPDSSNEISFASRKFCRTNRQRKYFSFSQSALEFVQKKPAGRRRNLPHAHPGIVTVLRARARAPRPAL
jgi:hypothetical protein